MNNAEWIARFLSYLRSEQGLSDNTVRNYERDLRKFSGWLDKPFASVHRIEIQRYLSDLINAGLNPKTAGRRLACFRHFYRFLIDEGEIAVNPTRNLPLPRTWKTIPKALGLTDLFGIWPTASPVWLQIVIVIVLGDALEYFYHRLSHTSPALWRLHALHHSQEELSILWPAPWASSGSTSPSAPGSPTR